MKRSALTIWFTAVAVLVAADGYVCFVNVRSLIEHAKLVSHSREIIIATERVLAALSEAESGERGYLLRGKETYLDRYREAGARLERNVTALADLVRDDPGEQESVATLKSLAADRLNDLRATIDAFNRNGLDAAFKVIDANAQKDTTFHAREVAGKVRQTEQDTLTRRSADRERSAATAIGTLVGSAVLNLLLLGLIALVVRRDAATRARAADDRVVKVALEHDNIRLAGEVEERRLTNEALTTLTTRLEQSNRELQDFASVASHDLQEPLRKIQAFGDRLRTKFADALGDTGRDYVDRMHAAANRMQTLINDLLAFARVTTKAQPFAPVDLNQIVHDVLADLETRIEQSGGRVDVGPLPTLHADPLQMRQLFQNLIANALKFHQPGTPPVVQISGAAPASGVASPASYEIRITDNGIGFDEKYLDRIFNVFQRLHGRDQYEGTGIGLAVCRKIVERHGGTITAHSREGAGSTFIVTLPTAHATTTTSTMTTTPSEIRPTEGDHADVPGTPADHDPARR